MSRSADHDQAVPGGAAGAVVHPALAARAGGTLVADPNGPLYDAQAQALAMDAPSAVDAGIVWNTATLPGFSAYELRVELSTNLGINSPGDWVTHLGKTLAPEYWGDLETSLSFRDELMRRRGNAVDRERWCTEMHAWLDATGHEQEAHDTLETISTRVDEVEQLLTDTGLLAAGERLRTVAGYQVGHAITVIRWGAHSGYADYPAITQSLLAARDLAGRHFASWREYAASHVAGAALAGPAEETAARFEQLLPAVATLLLSPESPWRNLEFPIVTDFDALLGVGAHDPDCPDKPFFPDDPED